MSQIELSLLVLRTADVQKTLSFYRAFGLEFDQECHAQGVIHYACTLGTSKYLSINKFKVCSKDFSPDNPCSER
ncbi:MAG: hypothetical protein V7L01_18475 [Nostoc sp.]|uniref:hypothetical protein n=1 Tax=Nostoc sp. TaxID=1180 RepID=UPI002FF6E114